jgi:hypothetical protein
LKPYINIISGLFVSLFFQVTLYSESVPSLYVGEINPRDRNSLEYASKIRSQIISTVLKYQKGKYTILDDELVKQLADKVARMQKQGCDDTECRRALDFAINWDEKIVGDLQKEGDKFSLSLKIYEMNKETFQPSVKGTVYQKFYPFQMDYYIKEMSRNLVDSNYTPNYAKAPKNEKEAELSIDTSFDYGKSFWGNVFFPGYNRIHNNDNSGYLLGVTWTASLIGIGATYSNYSSAKESNTTWNGYTLTLPFILPQGSEYVGGFYAVSQMNSFYKEAYNQGQIINGLGGFALAIWSYSWFYKPENAQSGLFRIPNSDWVLDINLNRRADRNMNGMFDNQYVIQIAWSF